MALDTRAKRMSAMLMGLPFRPTLPIAAGSIDQEDRQHLLYLCIVPLFGAPASTPSNLGYLTFGIGGGLGKTFLPSGNTVPVVVETNAPSGAPPSGKGVVYQVSGGTVTIHVWDGTQWVTK